MKNPCIKGLQTACTEAIFLLFPTGKQGDTAPDSGLILHTKRSLKHLFNGESSTAFGAVNRPLNENKSNESRGLKERLAARFFMSTNGVSPD